MLNKTIRAKAESVSGTVQGLPVSAALITHTPNRTGAGRGITEGRKPVVPEEAEAVLIFLYL